MAVDLATSGSLGYGIGLQGKVPDKSNLVLQLENQRLKRQALKGQEEEEKQKKEEKQLNLLAKGLNVDATKWHRTLVPTVQKYANDAMEEFYRLSKTNKNLAVNSIPQIMRSFEEKVSPLYTTNDQRKNFQKAITQKIINGERVPNDMLQFNQYLNMGDDASLDKPWESDLGIYKVTPNSIVTETVMPKSTAEEDAKLSADAVGNVIYTPDAMGVMASRVYDDASVLGYMNERYKDEQKKLSDIVYIEPNLRKVWRESGLEGQGVTFKKFTTDPSYAKDVENVLLEYNKSLLAKNAPASRSIQFDENAALRDAATELATRVYPLIGKEMITSVKELPAGAIDKAWDAYKQTDRGKMAIAKAGGEDNARDLFESYVPQAVKTVRERYKEMGGGSKAAEYTWKINTAPTGLVILNAENIDQLRKERETRAIAGKYDSEEMIATEFKTSKPTINWRIDAAGMKQASYDIIPTDLKTKRSWITGSSSPEPTYKSITGDFSSVLLDSSGNPKYIVVEEEAKPGEQSNTWVVPYESNKSKIVNSQEIEKSGAGKTESTYTIKGKKYTLSQLKGMGYTEQQVEQYKNK